MHVLRFWASAGGLAHDEVFSSPQTCQLDTTIIPEQKRCQLAAFSLWEKATPRDLHLEGPGNEPFSSVSLVKRPDGSLTVNLHAIDSIVQDAWLPIFGKYREQPEPSWQAFRARFGPYIRHCPLLTSASVRG